MGSEIRHKLWLCDSCGQWAEQQLGDRCEVCEEGTIHEVICVPLSDLEAAREELGKVAAKNERLRNEVGEQRRQIEAKERPPRELRKEVERLRSALDRSVHRGSAAEAQRDRYREALRPFAENAEWDSIGPDDPDDKLFGSVTLGEMRAARAALSDSEDSE